MINELYERCEANDIQYAPPDPRYHQRLQRFLSLDCYAHNSSPNPYETLEVAELEQLPFYDSDFVADTEEKGDESKDGENAEGQPKDQGGRKGNPKSSGGGAGSSSSSKNLPDLGTFGSSPWESLRRTSGFGEAPVTTH